jgi:hypothetical protein
MQLSLSTIRMNDKLACVKFLKIKIKWKFGKICACTPPIIP